MGFYCRVRLRGFGVGGLGFRGLRFRVWEGLGIGLRVYGVRGYGFSVWGLGLGIFLIASPGETETNQSPLRTVHNQSLDDLSANDITP